MKKHLIIDFETLSENALDCIVVNVSFALFDPEKKNSLDEILDSVETRKFNIKEQKSFGWKHSEGTLKFWKTLPVDAQKQLLPSPTDISVLDFPSILKNHIKDVKVSYWWTRGNNFDPVILKRIYNQSGVELDSHLVYYNVRDVRSFIDGFSMMKLSNSFMPEGTENVVKHISKNDIALDIMRIQAIWG